MEVRYKHSQPLGTSHDLEVIRPYWVARNYIPPVVTDKCQGSHVPFKLPVIQDYLKRKHKYSQKQGKIRTQVSQRHLNYSKPFGGEGWEENESIDRSGIDKTVFGVPKEEPGKKGVTVKGRHQKYMSSVENLNNSGEQIQEQELAFDGLKKAEWQIGKRNYNLKSKSPFHPSNVSNPHQQSNPQRHSLPPTRLLEEAFITEDTYNNENNHNNNLRRKQPSNTSHVRRLTQPMQSSQEHQFTQPTLQRLFPLNRVSMNLQGGRASGALMIELTEVEERLLLPGINQPLRTDKGDSSRISLLSSNRFSSLRLQTHLLQRESFADINSSNLKDLVVNINGQRSLKAQNRRSTNAINPDVLSFISPNYSEKEILQQDEAALVQEYQHLLRVLKVSLNKHQKQGKMGDKSLMELFARLKVIKDILTLKKGGERMQKYLKGFNSEVLNEIEKIFEKDLEYRGMLEKARQKYMSKELIAKKAKQNKIDDRVELQRNLKNIYEEVESLRKKKKHNVSRSPDENKMHKRYDSGVVQAGSKERQQDGEKEGSLNKTAMKKKILKNTVESKEHLHKGLKRKKSARDIKGKVDKKDQQKGQRRYQRGRQSKAKKNTTKRPLSQESEDKSSCSQIGGSQISYGSQKLINIDDRGTSLRSSFLKYIETQKSLSKSNIHSRLPSKVQSELTTPPELLQELNEGMSFVSMNQGVVSLQPSTGHLGLALEDQKFRSQRASKNKLKTKIARFQIDLYGKLQYPSSSSGGEEEEEQDLEEITKKRRGGIENQVDWESVARRIPKKRKFRPYRHQPTHDRRVRKTINHLDRQDMVSLRREVYGIIYDLDQLQLKQERDLLFNNQEQIRLARLKADPSPQEWAWEQQKWVQELDFDIKLVTKNREHLGGTKTPMMIMRHETENDPVELYEIAGRESKLADKLQERERMEMFAKESILLRDRNQTQEDSFACRSF